MEYQYIALGAVLAAAFYQDIKTEKIPNYLTAGAAVTGLLYHLARGGWQGLLFSLQGLAVGFGILFLLYLFRALGAGDVKLFAAIGALTGTEFVLHVAIYSMLFACAAGFILLFIKGNMLLWLKEILSTLFNLVLFRSRESFKGFSKIKTFRFPFMYGVLPGAIAAYCFLYIA